MRTHNKRARVGLLILHFALVLSASWVVTGCGGKKEEKSDPNYYTGPMKPKQQGGPQSDASR